MGDAYRDDRDGLRVRLQEAERAASIAEAHARDLEGQLAVATSTGPRLARLLAFVVVGAVSMGAGVIFAAMMQGGRTAALERRWQSIASIDLSVERLRDMRRCRLRFARAEPSVEHGRLLTRCHTRVVCDETIYDGLTDCGDRAHLDDGARISVDLLRGVMTLDGDAYRF